MSHEVTRILGAIEAGDPLAAQELLPLVYDELRRLAAAQLARERPGQTLDATGLVHEAYLRLVGDQKFEGRRHFFAAAAEAMRRVLVEAARRKGSLKRGGGRDRVPIDLDQLTAAPPGDDLLALDEALHLLAREEPEVAELVKLRYFAGLPIPKAAELLGVSPRTADAWWAFGRAWLLARLQCDSGEKK